MRLYRRGSNTPPVCDSQPDDERCDAERKHTPPDHSLMPNLMSKSPEEEQECELDEPQTESAREDGEDGAIEISLVMGVEVSIRCLQSCGHIECYIQVLGINLPETRVHQKKYVREHHECIVGEESAKNSQSYVETEGYKGECDCGHGPNSHLGSVQSQRALSKIDLCSLT